MYCTLNTLRSFHKSWDERMRLKSRRENDIRDSEIGNLLRVLDSLIDGKMAVSMPISCGPCVIPHLELFPYLGFRRPLPFHVARLCGYLITSTSQCRCRSRI